jgi:hypothetical protein
MNQESSELTTYETRVAEGRQHLITQVKPPCTTEWVEMQNSKKRHKRYSGTMKQIFSMPDLNILFVQ